jgi:hypothetical protein
MEKSKVDILRRESEQSEKSLERANSDLKKANESNKNLLIELKSLNNIIDEFNKQREFNLLETSFFKSELDVS